MNKAWEKKKAELKAQQEAFTGNRLLHRIYITKQGKEMIDTEPWPIASTLQRIATFMDPERHYTPLKVLRKLEGGEKLTTKYGAVYSLISKNY